MLAIRGLRVDYGRVRALTDVELDVRDGEIVALIGANGAGKSTLLKAVAGLVHPSAGDIVYDGQALQRSPTHDRVRRGLVLVPEGRGILTRMTVRENLLLGASARPNRASPEAETERILARFRPLAVRQALPASVLSGGEQQLLAIARALLIRPKLLMVDEPSLGLAPRITREIFELLVELRHDGVTILLVEQNARQALQIADRAYVFRTGRVVLSGTATELLGNPQVQQAYLGAQR